MLRLSPHLLYGRHMNVSVRTGELMGQGDVQNTIPAGAAPAALARMAVAMPRMSGHASGRLSLVEVRRATIARSVHREMVRNRYAEITAAGLPDGPQ